MNDNIEILANYQHLDSKFNFIFEVEWQAKACAWLSSTDTPREEKEKLMHALISFDDTCGDFYYYRAYLFAAEALACFPESQWGGQIVEQIIKWGYAYFREDKQDWKLFPPALTKAARNAIKLTDRRRVISAYINLIHTTDSQYNLRIAAKHLAQLDPGNQNAIAALVFLLQGSVNVETVLQIIDDLQEVGCGNEAVITSLINLIQTTNNKNIYTQAIIALGKVAKENHNAIAALIEFLQINRGDNICIHAVKSLWQIDPENPAIVNTLLEMLESDLSMLIIHLATDLLAQVAPGNDTAIAILLERLATGKEYTYISGNITGCIQKISPGNDTAIAILSNKLQASQTEEESYQFAVNILSIEPNNVEAVNALLCILENPQNGLLKQKVACKLIENDPECIPAYAYLPPLIAQRQRTWSRLQKAGTLLETEEHRQEGISLLLELTDFWSYGYEEYIHLPEIGFCKEYGSLPAICMLEKVDPTHQIAIQALEKLIQTTQDKACLEYALKKLAKLDPQNKLVAEQIQRVFTMLVEWIENNKLPDRDYQETEEECKYCHERLYQDWIESNPSAYKIFHKQQLQEIVRKLKPYLAQKYKHQDCDRYNLAYSIIWHCTENLTYSEFQLAWS